MRTHAIGWRATTVSRAAVTSHCDYLFKLGMATRRRLLIQRFFDRLKRVCVCVCACVRVCVCILLNIYDFVLECVILSRYSFCRLMLTYLVLYLLPAPVEFFAIILRSLVRGNQPALEVRSWLPICVTYSNVDNCTFVYKWFLCILSTSAYRTTQMYHNEFLSNIYYYGNIQSYRMQGRYSVDQLCSDFVKLNKAGHSE